MKFTNYIKSMLRGLYLSIKRFPLTIIFSASVAAVLISMSEINQPGQVDETLGKVAMALALGIPLSLSIKLLLERLNKEKTIFLAIGYGVSILLPFAYYHILLKDLNMINTSRYIGVSLALYLSFIFIPYLPRKEQFEKYVIRIATNFFITVVYSMVLFAGLAAILFAVDSLLGIKIQEEMYFYTWLMVVFVFAVTYFLSGMPVKNESLESRPYPKPLKILLLYIVMPLITVYTSILYIYFAKIIVTRQWPVGLVANLVLWYSVITVLVLFLATPIKEEKQWPNIFIKNFPKVILPVLAMMFVSIFIRINAYGITENRHYILLLALWVAFVMLYYCFRKKPVNIIIPVTLSILAIVSVFGPLSSFSISKFSQNKRLENLLAKNNMLKDGNIQPSSKISKEDKVQISSILQYFDRSHSLSEVKYLPVNFKLMETDKVFGFKLENDYASQESYFNFSLNNSEGPLDIKGYEYLFSSRDMNSSAGSLKIHHDHNSSVVKISYEGKEVYSKDFNDLISRLADDHGTNNSGNLLTASEMTFIDENEKIAVKFVFLNVSGMTSSEIEGIQINGMDFYIAVKIK